MFYFLYLPKINLMKKELIRVSDYARLNNKSLAWAYKQVETGKVKVEVIAGMKFVIQMVKK